MNKKHFIFSIFIALAFLGPTTHAALKTQLHHVQTKIDSTIAILQTDRQQHAHLQKKLQITETTLAKLENELNQTTQKLDDKTQALQEQQNLITQINQQTAQRQHKIALLIKAFYHTSQHQSTRDYFDPEHHHRHTRMVHHQQRIQNQLHQQMQTLKSQQQVLSQQQDKLHQQIVELANLRDHLSREQQAIIQHHQQRARVLNTLRQKIKTEQQQLADLKHNKTELSKLIKKLRQTKRHNAQYFVAHQHKMPWPVQGKHTTEFGDPIHNTNLASNGVVIQAAKMTPVRAIAPGIVVFDEWMPGFGLLVILDHGGGYMSIYGHNATIQQHVGQHVKAKDIIANVGSSGGLSNPELYFSIRHNGKPLNPAQWCT